MAEKICTKGEQDAAARFAFANGKILLCDPMDLTADMRHKVLIHGIQAKVGDTYAGAAKESDPIEWAYQQACAAWRAMVGGEWSQKRDGGSDLAQALADVTGRTLAEAVEAIAKLDDEAKKKLDNKLPAIKVALAQIALKRAQAKIGESDLNQDPMDLLGLSNDDSEEEA